MRATERSTAEKLKNFMKQDIVRLFGAPKTVFSNNVNFFTSLLLNDYKKMHGRKWRTVWSIGHLFAKTNMIWDKVVQRALSAYLFCLMQGDRCPFELLFGIELRTLSIDYIKVKGFVDDF